MGLWRLGWLGWLTGGVARRAQNRIDGDLIKLQTQARAPPGSRGARPAGALRAQPGAGEPGAGGAGRAAAAASAASPAT